MGNSPTATYAPGLAYHRASRGIHSRIIHASEWQPEVQQLDLRPTFRETPLSHVAKDPAHNHARSAALRSAAVDSMRSIVTLSGRTHYHVSMSKSDQRRGDRGDRFVYMSKDLQIPYRSDPVQESDVLIMTDVDYYVDMPSFLLDQDNSVLLYTVTPRHVAGKDDDGHFSFKDNLYHVDVAGGASYAHELWNYGNDHFSVSGLRLVFRWLPFPNPIRLTLSIVRWTTHLVSSLLQSRFARLDMVRDATDRVISRYEPYTNWFVNVIPVLYPTYVHKTFLCERRAISENRSLVLLQLEKRLRGWGALYASLRVEDSPLVRLHPDEVGTNGVHYNRLMTVYADKVEYSVSRAGAAGIAVIDVASYDALVSAWSNSKKVLTRATVESYFEDAEKSRKMSSILLDYLTNAKHHAECPKIYIGAPFLPYQRQSSSNYDDSAKLPMHSFMAPILGPVPVAEVCAANDSFSVEERIDKIKHTKPLRVSKMMRQYMEEYISFVVPDHFAHSLSPVDIEDVYERQNRPTQRTILDQADADVKADDDQPRIIRSFQKAQVENKLAPPRNISTMTPFDKMHYSAFIYAFTDYLNERDIQPLKTSKTPLEISEIVARECRNHNSVTLTDFSKMDGRASNVGRELYTRLLLRAFRPQYHVQLVKMIERSYNNIGYTKLGVRYFQDSTLASGSSDTSSINTTQNSFCSYCAHRYSGCTPEHAFEKMYRSLFTGDDGFMPDTPLDKFIQAAKQLGHVVTGRVATRERRDYVDYLSRYYGPEVWNGNPASCSDIKRRAWGLHATHQNVPTPKLKTIKAIEKARSYYLTDRYTPIIGVWACALLELAAQTVDVESVVPDSWWGRFAKQVQWVQSESDLDWMRAFCNEQLPGFNLRAYETYINDCVVKKDINGLLNVPCFLADGHLTVDAVPGVLITGEDTAQVRGYKRPKKQNTKSGDKQKPKADSKKKKKKAKGKKGDQGKPGVAGSSAGKWRRKEPQA